MKSKPARTLLSLTILSLSMVLNAAGRPSDQTVPAPEPKRPSPMLTGEAHAPRDPMSAHAALLTQMNGTNAVKYQLEPHWKLGTNTLVTGLIVDGVQPKLTWKMLNPPASASDSKRPPTIAPQSIKAAFPLDNSLADHEADFALLRFSLGSPPRVPKSAP